MRLPVLACGHPILNVLDRARYLAGRDVWCSLCACWRNQNDDEDTEQ